MVLEIKGKKEKFYIKVWPGIKVRKLKNILFFFSLSKNQQENSVNFLNFFLGFLKSLNVLNRKTLILNGLGLKFLLEDKNICLKLGFSHDIFLPVNLSLVSIKIKKYGLKGFFITFFSYNKVSLGNLTEKIYKLKKADCYKARGFYYKEKKINLKTIKKS